jgi:hypothetical protein
MAQPRIGPAQALTSARIVAIAFLGSAATMAIVGVVVAIPRAELQSRAELLPARESGTLLFALWVASAVGAMIGWGILWRRAAGLASAPGAHREIEAGRLQAGAVVQRLVAAYALLEAQMVIALVVTILGRTPMLIPPALALFAIGVLLSFPRREWFAPFERPAA